MKEKLLASIRHGRFWIDRFTRLEYRAAFAEYQKRYEALFVAALDAEEPEKLAEELVKSIEESWQRERFWNRSGARVDDKMVIVSYLTPMLLASEDERCRSLASALCRAWNDRRPNDTYRTAEYQKLLKGFRHSILGFDLEHKHLEEDDDR